MTKNHTSRSSKSMRSVQHVKGVAVFSFPDSVWKTSGWRTRKRGTKGQKGKRFRVGSGVPRRVSGKQASFKIKAVKPKSVKVVEPEPKKYTFYVMWENDEGKIGVATTKATSKGEANETAKKFPMFKKVIETQHESEYDGFSKNPHLKTIPITPEQAQARRYKLLIERLEKSGMRDPDNPNKTVPPSHPRTWHEIKRRKLDLLEAQRKISVTEYQNRVEKLGDYKPKQAEKKEMTAKEKSDWLKEQNRKRSEQVAEKKRKTGLVWDEKSREYIPIKKKPIEKPKSETKKKPKVKITYHKIKPKKEKEKVRTIRLSEESKTMPNRDEIEAEAYRMYMMDNPHFDTTPERDELSEEGYLRAAQRNLMSTGKAKDLEHDYINYLKRDLEERGYTIVPMR